MKYQDLITRHLSNVLDATNFVQLGDKYQGKVRDCYFKGDTSYLITSDRLSCFDRIITSIPFKGQVLTALAVENFRKTEHVIANHLIDYPDPNVMVVKKSEMLPIEVVVRGYLTGSAYRDYQAGRAISGITLPAGLKMSEKFESPLITPSTKAPHGQHDLPISEAEIVSQGIISGKLWQQVREAALALFAAGQKIAAASGYILVDTKYEFGLHQGKLILADEIHTIDSSRYWESSSYQVAFEQGVSPKMLDKENVRQWLIAQGFQGEGEVPKVSDSYRMEVASLYLNSFNKLTGQELPITDQPILERIAANLGLQQ